MALDDYHNSVLELPGGTYIAEYWPVQGLVGAVKPQGYEPPTFHKVKIVRGATERLWHVYAYERPELDVDWISTVHSQHLLKWSAERKAKSFLKLWMLRVR